MNAKLLGNQDRPYHVDHTTSRPLCEVKRRRARLVLRLGTTWEALVLFLLTYFCPPSNHLLSIIGYAPHLSPTGSHREDTRGSQLLSCPTRAYERTPTLNYTPAGDHRPAYTKQTLQVPGATFSIQQLVGYPLGANDMKKQNVLFVVGYCRKLAYGRSFPFWFYIFYHN